MYYDIPILLVIRNRCNNTRKYYFTITFFCKMSYEVNTNDSASTILEHALKRASLIGASTVAIDFYDIHVLIAHDMMKMRGTRN